MLLDDVDVDVDVLSFLYHDFQWLFPLSACETSSRNRSIYKSIREIEGRLKGLVWEMDFPSDGLLLVCKSQ